MASHRLHGLGYGFLVLGFLAGGCSSSTKTATKPDAATAGVSRQADAKTGAKTQASKPSSSLEEAQRGIPPEAGPLKEIYFDFDRYDLTPSARETLKANAAWLKANPSARVQIEGHADERGTNEYNLALGAKRAQSAKDYLTTLGIAADRLSTISYGEELPVCREQTEECWQKNRRDRFVVQPAKPAS
ncbi:MAG TPA: peptidoglycan-associated lipoprotein Pal [Candidatus Acidoferrales bacterium]|nr:peptidoglycan-associated lipoprotein Pal [Candidatus Acidoferrales bacterium]